MLCGRQQDRPKIDSIYNMFLKKTPSLIGLVFKTIISEKKRKLFSTNSIDNIYNFMLMVNWLLSWNTRLYNNKEQVFLNKNKFVGTDWILLDKLVFCTAPHNQSQRICIVIEEVIIIGWRMIWPLISAIKDTRERISHVQSRNERSCEVCKWINVNL